MTTKTFYTKETASQYAKKMQQRYYYVYVTHEKTRYNTDVYTVETESGTKHLKKIRWIEL